MGTAIPLDEIKRFEVTEVYSHPDAKVDIVLVHGLNGDPRKTWTSANGTFWPTQLLPVTLKSAQARVLVYGYNADVWAFGSLRSPSSDMIHQHAQTLLSNLALERKSEEQSSNPIIFVAHSLGGILVKRALEMSEQLGGKSADDLRSIFVSTYGVMFLGTPHNGADPAKWGLILQGMVNTLVPKKMVDTEAQMIKTLQRDNETLQNINLTFLEMVNRFKICMVHEAVKTDMKGTRGFIVDKDSAAPLLPDVVYFGIEKNHSEMCKFDSKNSPGYLAVSTTIKSWVQECLPVIQARQEFEMATRRQQKEFQANEMRGNFTTPPQQSSSTVPTPDPQSVNNSTILIKSTINIEPDDEPQPDQPYFIKPSGFRPNSLFVGRQTQMEDLHRMLFDRKKRSEGTSAVLIQSMPGGGKTHLAREYVYAHKDSFPGGIFWVRAKSCSEFTAGYWDIARHAALKHLSPESRSSFGDDPEQFMGIVRNWLNKRRDWLMVLDGIQFDSMSELQKYVPDSEGTALIYTSTDRSASGDHHWMNPQIIKLPLLSTRAAQELLLLELGRRKPFSVEDLKNSMELVQSLGLLPVVIHAVAQRLKVTNEPLARFARHYATEPRLRGLGTYIAVVEQLKVLAAFEALNLMYVLCFFSQYIPVEMISLGITVLEKLGIQVKSNDQYTGRTLNNTFRTLNMFALIERNEHDSSIHSSQSSKGSKEMLADNIDVIRLHSVVQGFFADTLHADEDPKTFPRWLDRAVRVFCCSYDNANLRITRKTNTGLVEDYRLYEIHGIRLREHVVRHEKKFSMTGTLAMLDIALARIKGEIERRTPDSSNAIAVGKAEVVQCSIFDRSSSSSDTGPETPGGSSRGPSASSTWLDPDQGQLESPNDILHQERGPNPVPHHYPPRIQDEDEDAGYDSDMDMTAIPSPQTIKPQASPRSPGGNWETVQPRRRPRPSRIDLGDHRTTRNLGKQKYSDRAGSFRSPRAMDPRAIHAHIELTRENATGFMHNVSSRAQSRGRISGQSNAEVALAHITQNSPPPPRGGGLIQGRSSSQRAERPRLVAGTASYAAAVSGLIRDRPEPDRPSSEPISSNESTSTLERPQSSAREALRRFEVTKQHPSPRSPPTPFTPMPPYPPSPVIEYQVRYPESDSNLYGLASLATYSSQENLRLGPDPHLSTTYPRKTGLQVDTLQSPSVSGPRKRSLPHDYPEFHSQSYSSSSTTNLPFLSLSSPNIGIHGSTYYPGYPEFSRDESGYTSQPMSRGPSGQTHSDRSHHSVHSLGERRAPSVVETEPDLRLPLFSPRIPPTSYQVYERMREDRHDRGMLRKSPRLEFSKLNERLEEWTIPNTAVGNTNSPDAGRVERGRTRKWNPAAPSFEPNFSFTNSPNIPAPPPNSMFSNPSYNTSPAVNQATRTSPRSFISTSSPSQSQYGPYPPPPPPSQKSPQSFLSYQAPTVPHTTPRSFQGAAGGEGMERSTSGGIKVGDGMGGSQVITFGDLEGVEVLQARERAERGRRERGMGGRAGEMRDMVERRGPSDVGLGIEMYRGTDSGRG